MNAIFPSATEPNNFPNGGRRTVAVVMRSIDPLSEYTACASKWSSPLDIARRQAREALARYESQSIHDANAMVGAATAFGYQLRMLLGALDAEDNR